MRLYGVHKNLLHSKFQLLELFCVEKKIIMNGFVELKYPYF